MEMSCKSLVKEKQHQMKEQTSSLMSVEMNPSPQNVPSIHILDMPDSIFLQIFVHLPFTSIGLVAQVCRRWHCISSDDLLWRQVFLKYFKLPRSTVLAPRATCWRSELKRLHYHTPVVLSEAREEHKDEVLHVSFSNDGTMFATCSKDGYFKVWECDHPCKLLFKMDMKNTFSWKFTQFSQFNETDTLLLVSGVYFGHLSTSGEIAVFDIQDNFQMQCRVTNKPYDVFGAWYDNNHLLSGTLYWTGDFNSVSAVWLSKASQEVESVIESVSMIVYRFENVNSSSIRLLHVAEVGRERPSRDRYLDSKTGSTRSSTMDIDSCVDGRHDKATTSSENHSVDEPGLLDQLLRKCISEDEFDLENEDKTEDEEDEREEAERIYREYWHDVREGHSADHVRKTIYLKAEEAEEWGLPGSSNRENIEQQRGEGNVGGEQRHSIENEEEMVHLDSTEASDTVEADKDTNKPMNEHGCDNVMCSQEGQSSRSLVQEQGSLTCETEDSFESPGLSKVVGSNVGDKNNRTCPSAGLGSLFCSSHRVDDSLGREIREGYSKTDPQSMELDHASFYVPGIPTASSLSKPMEYKNRQDFSMPQCDTQSTEMSDVSNAYDSGEIGHVSSTMDTNNSRLLASSSACVVSVNSDVHGECSNKNNSVISERKEGACIVDIAQLDSLENFQGAEMSNSQCKPTTASVCVTTGVQDEAGTIREEVYMQDCHQQELDQEAAAAAVHQPAELTSKLTSVGTQTEDLPSRAASWQSLSHSSSLSCEFQKPIREKLLVYTWGSETYIPHKIGIKRMNWSDFNKGEVTTRRSRMLLPDVLENLHNMVEDRRDKPDITIEMHGHIVGLSLSPDHRYLYVNCRPWPRNYIISDPQESPPLAQEVEISSIDLTTFEFVGPVLRSHRAYTDNEECFFLNLDVSDDFVVSGAEDHQAYLWDRHYGKALYRFPHSNVVNCVAVNPQDPETMVTVSDDHTFKVWRSRNRMKELECSQATVKPQEGPS